MAQKDRRIELTGEQAGQGHVVLKTPLRKAIFLGGLAALVVLAIEKELRSGDHRFRRVHQGHAVEAGAL